MHRRPSREALDLARLRLTASVVVDAAGCWLWQKRLTQAPDGGGYGKFWWNVPGHSENWLAHRAAWVIYRGLIPAGLTIDHLCNVRRCVNPAHLQLATVRENVLRGNGWAARNARKTHCNNGHLFTPETTGQQKKGRFCRICRREDYKRYRRKQRAAS